MNWDIIADYFRMVSFGVVILASLRGILKRNFTNLLFVGNIVTALGLLVTGFVITIYKQDRGLLTDCIITPVAVVWAIINFAAMVRFYKGKE